MPFATSSDALVPRYIVMICLEKCQTDPLSIFWPLTAPRISGSKVKEASEVDASTSKRFSIFQLSSEHLEKHPPLPTGLIQKPHPCLTYNIVQKTPKKIDSLYRLKDDTTHLWRTWIRDDL